jgi:16S rRNA processing protein RimM
VIGLEGIETMDDAERLAEAELKVPAATLAPLPEKTFYRHQLVGCEVQDTDGRLIGEVAAVEGSLEMSRLVINAPHGEVLIPLVDAICVEVAPAERRIRIKAPEGLIELNTRPGSTPATVQHGSTPATVQHGSTPLDNGGDREI